LAIEKTLSVQTSLHGSLLHSTDVTNLNFSFEYIYYAHVSRSQLNFSFEYIYYAHVSRSQLVKAAGFCAASL